MRINYAIGSPVNVRTISRNRKQFILFIHNLHDSFIKEHFYSIYMFINNFYS